MRNRVRTSVGGIILNSVLAFVALLSIAATAMFGLVNGWPITANMTGVPDKVSEIEWEGQTATAEEAAENLENQAILYGLNEAMQNNDREAFISWGEGDGQIKLGAWWDITKQIGWEHASVDGEGYGESGNLPQEVSWFFSSELGSQITTLIPSEKGLTLTQGEYYNLTISGEKEEARITSMESDKHYFAWSYLDGNVHIAKRDNSVTVGKADEADYIESKADVVEATAVKVLSMWKDFGAEETPTNGILVQLSQHQSVLDQWLGADIMPGLSYAGIAITSSRPFYNQPYISPQIATGERTSGSFVLMSPRAEGEWSNAYESVLLHEAVHAFHRAAYPLDSSTGDHTAAAEGLAEYAQMKYLSPGHQQGYEYYSYLIDTDNIRENIANLGFNAFSTDRLRSDTTGHEAYLAAGLLYDYAAQGGVSPWSLALAGTETSTPLGELIVEMSGGSLTEEGYKNFVRNKQF